MIRSGLRPGFGPDENPAGRFPTVTRGRVRVLTPGWSAIVLVAIVGVIGFEDDDRSGQGGASSLNVGRGERPIRKVAFTTDDTRVATLEVDGRLTFWEAEGGGFWTTIGGNDRVIRSFAFDPGCNMAALGHLDGSIRFMSLRTGEDCGRIELEQVSVHTLAFSPDGRRIATGQGDGRLTLWEVETRSLRLDLKTSQAPLLALAFSPDGRRLASAHADGLVIVWETETGRVQASTSCGRVLLRPLVFSPDGETLWWAIQHDKVVWRWDLGSGGEVQTVPCPVEEMVPMPDGRSLLVRIDQERVWQLSTETLRIQHRYRFPGRILCSMGVSSDGTRIALGGLETVEVATLAHFEDPSAED
ncbi:WD40 repeat domain-containing protein [Tautonia marina]|uniref:WD40 repeat domain-containing protein n=1 Tax=Tautonia marina TaxID=2653855 RepID=UPI001260EABD|nr:hypothetical protein [Tautonia marina]